MFVFFGRSIKFAFQGFIRNIWLSIVTIIILVLMLFSVTMVAGINFVADSAINSVQDKVDVSIYFKPDTNEEDIVNIQYRLESLSEVKEVTYISEDQALENFRENHKDDVVILESLDELDENPLSATLIVKANTIDDYPDIIAILENPDYELLIRDRNFEDNEDVINKLSEISSKIERVGIMVSIVFIIIAILIVFNTIRINIYTHREEIGIMKLVGATNWFVRAPFLLESLIYAVLGVIITMAILFPLIGVIAPQINSFFDGYKLDIVSYFNENIIRIVGMQLGFVVFLCIISSSIAIGRYLRV
ncbi:MAG: permease-like cell division protein FtsX [bacterium]|nr:permease-like cell division protein FtsX [bacterium]